MKSAKRRNDFPWVLLCGCLCAAGLSLFGMEGLEADETPVEIHSVLLQPGSGDDAVVLADRLILRESFGLVLDAERRDRLVHEIDQVLVRIRTAYPEIKGIPARPLYEPGMLLLGLESDLLMVVSGLARDDTGVISLQTGHAEFDALNATLGLSDMQLFRHTGVVALEFDELVNLGEAIRAYQEIPGVRFAEPGVLHGDGPDIELSKTQGMWYVIARKAWGDCPSGCIHEELHFFTVANGEVSRVEALHAREQPGFASLVADRGWN